MKHKIWEFAHDMRERIKKQYLNGEDRVLTNDEERQIDEKFQVEFMRYVVFDKKPVAPEVMLEELKRGVPFIKAVPEKQKEERMEKRLRAARSFSLAMTETNKFIPGTGNFSMPRPHYRACNCMNPEQLQTYMECYPKTKDSYYVGSGMSQKEIAAEIQKNTKEVNHALAGSIMNMVDQYYKTLMSPLSDEELIKRYPEILRQIHLVIDAPEGLMKDIKKYQYDDIPWEKLEEYDSKLVDLMATAPVLEKRMATMADPYYEHIMLEDLFEADSNKLDSLSSGIGMPENDKNTKIIQISMDDEEIFKELENETQAKEEYGTVIDSHENILCLAGDAKVAKGQMLRTQIESYLGVSHLEFQDNWLLYDVNGKTCDIDDIEPDELLAADKMFYVVSKYGDDKPVPVFLDITQERYKVIVGPEAMADAPRPKPVEPTRPGWWTRAVSSVAKSFGLKPTPAMRQYLKEKEEYDRLIAHGQLMDKVQDGKFPDELEARTKQIREKNSEIEKNRVAREKQYEDAKFLMKNTPNREMDLFYFPRALADVLVHKAFLSNSNSRFRSAMFDQLGVHDADYKESVKMNALRTSEPFTEFAWRIQKEHPEMVKKLRSDNPKEVEQAIEDISERFRITFGHKNLWKTKASVEYKAAVKEIEKVRHARMDVQPGHVLSPESMKTQEAYYDNQTNWETIMAWYGPVRPLHIEWTNAGGDDGYQIKHWRKMQESEVNIADIRPENMEMDDKTFASLNMMLSIRDKEYFQNGANVHAGKSMPDTMSFEDIMVTPELPRAGSWRILDNIVEPTRAKMIDCLKHMNEPLPGSNPSITGKEQLAKDLAVVLENYSRRVHNYSWSERTHSTFGEVGIHTMNFIRQHDMLQMVLESGLSPDAYRDILAIEKMAVILKDACNAQQDLVRDNENKIKLSPQERLECINKIMLGKALTIDTNSYKKLRNEKEEIAIEIPDQMPGESNADYNARLYQYQMDIVNKNKTEAYAAKDFSPNIMNLISDGSYLEDLSQKVLSKEDRSQLANKSSKEILDVVNVKLMDSVVSKWIKKLKENPELEEKRLLQLERENNIKNKLEMRLQELGKDPKYEAVIKASEKIMKDGPIASVELLVRMEDPKLLRCSELLQKDPNLNFSALIDATMKGHFERPNIQPVAQKQEEQLKEEQVKVEKPQAPTQGGI